MQQFNTILKKRLAKIEAILGAKEEEYAKDSNRYHNFDQAAKIENCSEVRALWGMFMKHFVSVQDIVDLCDRTDVDLPEDLIDEKIGDTINYLILLEGILCERYMKKQPYKGIISGHITIDQENELKIKKTPGSVIFNSDNCDCALCRPLKKLKECQTKTSADPFKAKVIHSMHGLWYSGLEEKGAILELCDIGKGQYILASDKPFIGKIDLLRWVNREHVERLP